MSVGVASVGGKASRRSEVPGPRAGGSWLSFASLEKRLVSQVKTFVASVLEPPVRDKRREGRSAVRPATEAPSPPRVATAPPPPPPSRRSLVSDLYLTMGPVSVRLFPAGPIDEFRFFQRFGVSPRHEVEFVTRLDASDAGTENFQEFAVFRLRGEWQPLPDLSREDELRRALRGYGLEHLPLARRLVGEVFHGYDPERGRLEGQNRLSAPASAKTFKKVGDRRFSHSDVLEILRGELTAAQRIAWVEGAFPRPSLESPVVHRYYLDASKQAYLVRDTRKDGKRLYLAETSSAALSALLASGTHVRRFGSSAAC